MMLIKVTYAKILGMLVMTTLLHSLVDFSLEIRGLIKAIVVCIGTAAIALLHH